MIEHETNSDSRSMKQNSPSKDGKHTLTKGDRLTIAEKLAREYVKRPLACYFFWWIFLFLVTAFVMNKGWFKVGDIAGNDWIISSSNESIQFDALSNAVERYGAVEKEDDSKTAFRESRANFQTLQIIMDWGESDKDGPILTPKSIQGLCQVENVMINTKDFRKFCQTKKPEGNDSECIQQIGTDLIASFYSAEERKKCEMIPQADFDSKKKALLDNSLVSAFFKNPEFKETGKLRSVRSQISLGGPLGPDSVKDKSYSKVAGIDTSEQGEEYKPFFDELHDNLLEFGKLEGSLFSTAYSNKRIDLGDDLSIRFHSYYARTEQFDTLVSTDQLLASAAAALVGVLIYLHIRNLWVTINSVISIMLSLPLGLFIYSGVLGILYFNSIHIVALFLILGIGADDCFVFMDSFKASADSWVYMRGHSSPEEALEANTYGTGDKQKEVLIARLAYCWRRTATAVFSTSFTTFIAFMATGISPVAPISSFGIFAALVVMSMYIITLTLFPGFLVVSETYFSGRPFCCACVRAKKDIENDAATVAPTESVEEKIINKLYVPFLLKVYNKIHANAWASFLFLFSFSILMVSFAMQLTTPAQADEPFASSHMFTGFLAEYNDFSGGSTGFVQPDIVFGIDGVDRSKFEKYLPDDNRGNATFNKDFKLAPRVNQEFLVNMCKSLEGLFCAPKGETTALDGCTDLEGKLVVDVQCTITDFHSWHDATYASSALELGDKDEKLFLKRLQEYTTTVKDPSKTRMIGFDDAGNLKYFRMQYKTSLKVFRPEQIKGPILQLMDDWYDEQKKLLPKDGSMDSFYQVALDMVWIVTERGIVTGMFQGLMISLPGAFVVMLITTFNFLLSFFALASVSSIVACVLGFAQVLGWSLGIGEAIAAVMVVGLSVDYVLHLGQIISHAVKEGHLTGEARFAFAARLMGPTVLAAAATTGLSIAMLFFCQLDFFSKMGTLIVITVISALFFSLFFFMPLALLFLRPVKNKSIDTQTDVASEVSASID